MIRFLSFSLSFSFSPLLRLLLLPPTSLSMSVSLVCPQLQFTIRNGRGRFGGTGGGGNDRKPLVLSTYLDAQEHLPYADDSNAVTPMSEENGAIIVPVYYANLGSRHSSYTSHQSRISYTSHGDLLGGMTKESRLRNRSRNASHALQPPPSITMGPFEPNHKPTPQNRDCVS